MADTEEKGPSKRALEKERKKAEAKAKKEAAKSASASTNTQPKTTTPSTTTASDPPPDPFKRGWLRETYAEKPLPAAQHVQTRFPPEPNGYLHIGHAKAITVNFGFAASYSGSCNLRYDDTNPSKEEAVYFDSILEMVKWLGFEPSRVTYSSDEFGRLYELAEKLVMGGGAYVCLCAPKEVKRRKGQLEQGGYGERSVCEHWSWSPGKNLAEFRRMRDGAYKPLEAHLRMKQFLATPASAYASDPSDDAATAASKSRLKALATNPALWDCAAYRIPANSHHHRTGDAWRIYPTYEFTHCICDALEGITHSLCTTEFETLRPAYNWLLERLEMKKEGSEEKGPMQREYGRLSVEGTVLSKRRILMLVSGTTVGGDAKAEAAVNGEIEVDGEVDELADDVEEKLTLAEDGDLDPSPSIPSKFSNNTTARHIPPVVTSWSDPRLHTLVALRRRGIPPGALKKFVLDLGVTKSNANTATHSFDAAIRNYLEKGGVPRLLLVLDPIRVEIVNWEEVAKGEEEVRVSVPFNPKEKDGFMGMHDVPFTKTIWIERDDFREEDDADFFRLSPGQSVGLLYLEHALRCVSFSKNESTGLVESIKAEYGPEVAKPKARIHWVAESPKSVKAEVRVFNSLFKSSRPNELDWKTGGYYDDINPESLVVYKEARMESGWEDVRRRAPWPKEHGGVKGGQEGKSGTRFQGLRTGFFCEDEESEEGRVVVNRIVSLREDGGRK